MVVVVVVVVCDGIGVYEGMGENEMTGVKNKE